MASTLDRIVPLPKTLQLLTLTTLTISFAVFVLGLLDLATAGFFLIVAASGTTMLHDITTIIYARRLYPNQTPIFFPPAASYFNILFLGVCAFIYTVGTAMVSWSSNAALSGEISWATPANAGTVVAQAALGALSVVLLLFNAFWCWRSRKEGLQYGYGELF